jgi:hypothetical protein
VDADFWVLWVDYPAALIVLDLVLGGPSKGIAGTIGMFAGHAWYVSLPLPSSHTNHRIFKSFSRTSQ